MGYRNLRHCIDDLERHGHLVRIDAEIDPYLEAAEIQRRVCAAGGPALLFTRVTGSRFPLVSNLFGTIERARFMFRDTLDRVRRLIELKLDPAAPLKRPLRYLGVPRAAWSMLPATVGRGPVTEHETTISQLPRLVCWPEDGGAFITLPQVYTEDVRRPGGRGSNLGMYRIQLSGGEYERDREIGLHYQIHRTIGVHHAAALAAGEPLKVNIFVGGSPAMMLSAVMPLPEGMSELVFAGALGGRRIRLVKRTGGLPIYADADFCICGTVIPEKLLPEGPFGDHLGYYSLRHDFPVLRVEHVFHKEGAIWPFTVVGRPPQEDSIFGELIHELTAPVIPSVLPGVAQVHAVDAAGVHPLLLAIGSERYMPFMNESRPQELLTQANAILGQGQLSLAKFLLIVNERDNPRLRADDVAGFFRQLLERADWSRDLHFQTQTTIDTLDYTGGALNRGSKVVIAAAGPKRYELATEITSDLRLPAGFHSPRVTMPGVLAIAHHGEGEGGSGVIANFTAVAAANESLSRFRWIVIVDDSQFVAESLRNFLWVTFTRVDPAADIHGIDSFVENKHWGCRGPLVIDARLKPHHAPPLVENSAVTKRVDALGAAGGPLHGIF